MLPRLLAGGRCTDRVSALQMFVKALQDILEQREIPLNVSQINDYIRRATPTFHIKMTSFTTFANLCRAMVDDGVIKLDSKGDTVLISWTKFGTGTPRAPKPKRAKKTADGGDDKADGGDDKADGGDDKADENRAVTPESGAENGGSSVRGRGRSRSRSRSRSPSPE